MGWCQIIAVLKPVRQEQGYVIIFREMVVLRDLHVVRIIRFPRALPAA